MFKINIIIYFIDKLFKNLILNNFLYNLQLEKY